MARIAFFSGTLFLFLFPSDLLEAGTKMDGLRMNGGWLFPQDPKAGVLSWTRGPLKMHTAGAKQLHFTRAFKWFMVCNNRREMSSPNLIPFASLLRLLAVLISSSYSSC